jgi:hypothetical protein
MEAPPTRSTKMSAAGFYVLTSELNMKIKSIPVLLLTALATLALIPRAAAQGEDVAAVVNPNQSRGQY